MSPTITKGISSEEIRSKDNHQKYVKEKEGNMSYDKKERRNVAEKKLINSHVVLLMDSNRKYIDVEKFWRGKRCTKMAAGNVEETRKIIDQYNFINTKHIIVHVGTNDVENDEDSPEEICKNIIKIGLQLKNKYKLATVFISQLPPRDDKFNGKSIKVNELLTLNIPESLKLINNSNITKNDLHDKKHIRKEAIKMLVMNMKKAMKESRNIITREEEIRGTDERRKNMADKDLHRTLK